jgi:hypothetical protein
MSLSRVVLLLLAVALGAGAVLLVEGNTTIVGLHLGSFAGRAEAPLWLVIASAFLGGAITAGLLVGMVWLIGPFFKVLVSIFFVFILCLAAARLRRAGRFLDGPSISPSMWPMTPDNRSGVRFPRPFGPWRAFLTSPHSRH